MMAVTKTVIWQDTEVSCSPVIWLCQASWVMLQGGSSRSGHTCQDKVSKGLHVSDMMSGPWYRAEQCLGRGHLVRLSLLRFNTVCSELPSLQLPQCFPRLNTALVLQPILLVQFDLPRYIMERLRGLSVPSSTQWKVATSNFPFSQCSFSLSSYSAGEKDVAFNRHSQ